MIKSGNLSMRAMPVLEMILGSWKSLAATVGAFEILTLGIFLIAERGDRAFYIVLSSVQFLIVLVAAGLSRSTRGATGNSSFKRIMDQEVGFMVICLLGVTVFKLVGVIFPAFF